MIKAVNSCSYLFFHQVFTESLPCAEHYRKHLRNMSEQNIPALKKVTFRRTRISFDTLERLVFVGLTFEPWSITVLLCECCESVYSPNSI